MSPDRSHSDTVGRVANKLRVEGGSPLQPLLLRSEISLFWRTSCQRFFFSRIEYALACNRAFFFIFQLASIFYQKFSQFRTSPLNEVVIYMFARAFAPWRTLFTYKSSVPANAFYERRILSSVRMAVTLKIFYMFFYRVGTQIQECGKRKRKSRILLHRRSL